MNRETITIDARMLTFSGIGTYLMTLLAELALIESEFDFEIICSEPELLRHLPPERFRFVESKAPIYSLREQWEILRLVRGCRLLHCPHYNVPYFHRGRMVVTIHDLNHLTNRGFLPNGLAYWYASFMLAAATQHATRIITVSQHSRKSIQQTFHVPDEKIWVIYNGLPRWISARKNSAEPSRLGALKVRKPYVLFVGILKPHKNVQGLLRAFSLVPADKRKAAQLVIVGKKDTFYPHLLELARTLSLEEQVVFTGTVSAEDLRALYSEATLLVLPSLSEGFGYPVLEAMAFGVPVVVSDTSSLPEVAGAAGVVVDPREDRSFANAIEKLLSDEGLRQTLSERSRERARLFSARKCALDHLEVYRAALSS